MHAIARYDRQRAYELPPQCCVTPPSRSSCSHPDKRWRHRHCTGRSDCPGRYWLKQARRRSVNNAPPQQPITVASKVPSRPAAGQMAQFSPSNDRRESGAQYCCTKVQFARPGTSRISRWNISGSVFPSRQWALPQNNRPQASYAVLFSQVGASRGGIQRRLPATYRLWIPRKETA